MMKIYRTNNMLPNKWENQIQQSNPIHKTINLCLEIIDIKISERTQNSQFHFDLEEKSQRNFFQVLHNFRYFFRRGEKKEEWKLACEKIRIMIKERNDHFEELGAFLNKWDLSFKSNVEDVLILQLKNLQDASCVASVLHHAKLKDKKYLNILKEYTSLKEELRVKEFYEKKNIIDYFIGYGPRMMILFPRSKRNWTNS